MQARAYLAAVAAAVHLSDLAQVTSAWLAARKVPVVAVAALETQAVPAVLVRLVTHFLSGLNH